MATDPIGSFSGLASGIQWRDMVDQIMQLEEARTLTPLSREISASQARADAWKSYGTLAGRLNDAAKTLRDGTAFQAFKLSVGNSTTTSRTLLAASASSATAPGSYRVEVQQLAAAEKLGGAHVSDATAALGASGWLRVNGRAVEVLATDSLNAVRDKINAVNSGGSASKVTASVLTVAGRSRLVLASDATGAAGIELGEVRASAGSPSLLETLGFADAAAPSLNLAGDGAVQSARLSSVSGTIMAALGVTVSPPPATIVVNGKSVAIPEGATVSDVVALINAQSPGAARTEADGASYRLEITGSVAAGDAGGTVLLEALGVTERGRGAATQRVTTANALAASGAPATEATALADLGATTGDTFTITGTTTAGAPVNTTFTVGGASTLGDLTAAIRTAYGSATVDVSVDADGRIVVADKSAGDSLLAFNVTQGVAGGAGIDFGGTTVAETGRKRQLVAGADARIVVDDALVLRASNTITDAIGGVTLELKQAEAGTTIAVDVARDVDGGVKAVQDFAKALNDLTAFAAKETSASGRLAFNGALRSSVASMKNLLLTDVAGLAAGAPYTRGALVGVAFSKAGTLDVDASALRSALASNLADVQRLFGTGATSTDSRLQYQWAGRATAAGRYTVDVTQAATAAGVAGAVQAPGWTYTESGSGDQLEITDAASGTKATLALATGDGVDAIVTKLNALFTTQKMRVTASNEGGALRLAHQEYGATPGFTVAYLGDAAGAEAQLGLASGTYHGVNAAGTITGGDPAATVALTGSGQLLTAPAGSAAEGLVFRYAGTAVSTGITVDFALGYGGVVSRAAEAINATDGFVATQTGSIDTTVARLQQRSDDVQSRLDARRESMIRQFTAMEAALSKITAQGSWLASQVAALQSSKD